MGDSARVWLCSLNPTKKACALPSRMETWDDVYGYGGRESEGERTIFSEEGRMAKKGVQESDQIRACTVCRYSEKGVGFDIDTRAAPLKPVRNCTFFAFCQYISSFYHERPTSNCQLFAFASWPCFVRAARTLLAFGALDLFYSCILHQTSDSDVVLLPLPRTHTGSTMQATYPACLQGTQWKVVALSESGNLHEECEAVTVDRCLNWVKGG
jgi:hypothetical protein